MAARVVAAGGLAAAAAAGGVYALGGPLLDASIESYLLVARPHAQVRAVLARC